MREAFYKRHEILLVLILFGFSIITFFLYFRFTTDDAFIHMVYAMSLTEGNGYSFAGNRVYGTTAPLWPLLIAGLFKAGISFELSAKLLSFSFAIMSIIMFYKILINRFSLSLVFTSLILYLFNSYLMRWTWSGMEATAAVFFSLYLIYVFAIKKKCNKIHFLLIGLSPLIRPEFYLFLLIFFSYKIFTEGLKKDFFYSLVITSIPAILWNIIAFLQFGTIVPTTFMSKAGSSLFSIERYILLRNIKLFVSGNFIEISLVIILSIFILKKSEVIKTAKRFLFSPCFPVFLCISLFYLFYILKNVKIISRYSLPLIPYIIYLTTNLIEEFFNKYYFKRKTILLLVILTSFFLSTIIFTFFVIKPDADSFANGFQKTYKKMASILYRRRENSNESVMLSDVGIIGLYSGMRVYDFVGLVDKDRWKYSNNIEYFVNKKPTYLILRGEFELTPEFKEKYNITTGELYSTIIHGFGINTNKIRLKITLLKINW